jgi:prepilin peptidase CpaA
LDFAFASDVAFAALLTAAVVTDVRTRRIPNALVLALLCTGVVSTGLLKGSPSVLPSLGASALGLAIWFPFYAFRMMGAGDVKLLRRRRLG